MWLDVFIEHRRFIIIQFTDGRRLYGWPELYSDDVNEGLLYLTYPQWIDDDGQYVPLKVSGFLIVDRSSIKSIMFTDIGYNNVEFEIYGEQSTTTRRSDEQGVKRYSETGSRKESAPDSTADQTTSSSSAPTTQKDKLISGSYIGG